MTIVLFETEEELDIESVKEYLRINKLDWHVTLEPIQVTGLLHNMRYSWVKDFLVSKLTTDDELFYVRWKLLYPTHETFLNDFKNWVKMREAMPVL